MIFQINKMHNGSQKIFKLRLTRTYLTLEQIEENCTMFMFLLQGSFLVMDLYRKLRGK